MIIFKDIFTDKDAMSDAFQYKLVDDLYYEFTGKHVEESNDIDDSVFGGNKSAEAEETEEYVSDKKTVINFISSNKLEEDKSMTKKIFKDEYIKGYVKKLIKKVEEVDAERAKFLQSQLPGFVKKVLGSFGELNLFFTEGDQYEHEGGCIFVNQGDHGEILPIAWVLKDGVVEEKC